MMSDYKLEMLEKKYLDFITTGLCTRFNTLMEGLNSRLEIKEDWVSVFNETARPGYRASNLEYGAERIIHHLLASLFTSPNSCPIGSDLMYRIDEAIIHIEVKTKVQDNPDYRGKVTLGRNQMSYGSSRFKPNLPQYYKGVNVPSLTYAIQIIHNSYDWSIEALTVIAIPNGQLFSHYGASILKAGKSGRKKAQDVRYKYIEKPLFLLLNKASSTPIYRIEVIARKKGFSIKQLTSKELDIATHKILPNK